MIPMDRLFAGFDRGSALSFSFAQHCSRKFFQPQETLKPAQLARATADFEELIRKKMEELYQVYQSSFSGGRIEGFTKPVLLIGHDVRKDDTLVSNFGALSGTQSGAVFVEQPWTIVKNDLMMLGTIHAGKTVLLVGGARFHDERTGSLTVLGREIAMLEAAGYKAVSSPCQPMMGSIFASTDPTKAEGFILTHALAAIRRVEQRVPVVEERVDKKG